MNINKRLAILSICLSAALTGCGDKSTDEYIESGDLLVKSHDVGNASIAYQNALKSDPKNAELRYKLGMLYVNMGDAVNAEKELDMALRLNFNEVEIAPGLARVKLELNKYHDLYPLADIDFLGDKDAEIRTLFYTSVAAIKDGKGERANDFFKRAIKIDGESSYALLIDAWMTFAYTKRPDIALVKVNRILEDVAELDYAIFLKGLLLQTTEKHAEAAIQFKNYLALNPKDLTVKFYLIKSLIESNQLKEAGVNVDGMLARNPKHPYLNLFKAQIEFKNKNFTESLSRANAMLLGVPDSESAKMIAGVSAFKLGLYEQAYSDLNQFEKGLNISALNRILAIIRLKLGRNEDAADTFAKEDVISDKDIEILQMASAAMANKGNVSKADSTINMAMDLAPENARLLAQKGIIELSKNNETGIDLLNESLKLDPTMNGARLALAMQFIDKGEFEKAMNVAGEWEKVESEWVLAQLLKGKILSKQGRFEDAGDIYRLILKREPNNIPSLFNLGQMAEQNKEIDKAVSYYKTLLTAQPDHMPTIGRLTTIGMDNHQDTIFDFLLDLHKKAPENINLLLGVAYNYELREQYGKALRTLKSTKEKNLPDAYYMVLGNLYVKDSNIKQGVETLKGLIDSSPNNYDARLSYLTLLEKAKHYTSGKRAVKNALLIFKDDPRMMIFQIHFEMAVKDFKEANKYIKQYLAKHQTNLVIKKFEAKIASSMNELDNAEMLYSDLYEQVQSNENAKNLARVLFKNDNSQEAIALLASHLNKQGEDAQLRSMLADLYIVSEPKKAMEHYKILLDKEPKNVIWLNNIAMAEMKLGDKLSALEHAKQAYYLSPNNFNIADTYAKALLGTGDTKQSIQIFEMSIRQGSESIESKLELAELYQSVRRYKEAKDLISKIKPELIKDEGLKERYNTIINRM